MTILVITTGGTIGALPYDNPVDPPKFSTMPMDGKDRVGEALAERFSVFPSRCVSLEPRDSKLFDDTYRDYLAAIIAKAGEKHVLITHGTDTLLTTAEFLYRKTELKNKTVMLTGAMIPLANGPESDGFMNLRFALEQLSRGDIAPGIFITLSDYTDARKRQGWAPRLYPFAPGKYEKYYDAEDGRWSRLKAIGN